MDGSVRRNTPLLHQGSPAAAADCPHTRAALSAPEFLHQMLETDLACLCALTGCEVAAIYVLDGESTPPRLRLFAQRGLNPDQEAPFSVLARSQGLAMEAVGQGGVVLGELAPGAEYAASAAAPITVGDWTVGAVLVMSHEPQELGGEPTDALNRLGSRLGQTITSWTLQQEVRQERDLYQRVAHNLRDCIWTYYVEPTPHFSLITDGIEDLTGYTAAEVLSMPGQMLDLIAPDDRTGVQQDLVRIALGETMDLNHRVRLVHKNGELRWVFARGHAVRDEQGLRVDAVTTDVTDHVRLEEKVRRADRLSAVSILAGGIAHEYNNLHFAILGTLDLLLMRTDLDESLRGHINRVREAAERASDITNKLVSFARGGAGGREIMEVSELVEATLGMVQKEFMTKGIEVDIKQSPLPLKVRGNRAELGQVLINLVINAQQAMQEGPNKRLMIATGTRDGRVFIGISDTGHGIKPENLPRLFDPFFTTKGAAGSWSQERAASEAHLPGRGLGLSVAQTIVEEHGGDIEVESEVGCGTKFTVYLPPPDLADPHSVESTPGTQVHKGRIMIADDEAPVREVCREFLEQMGYEVAEAEGGAEALEKLGQQDFDLILVDLQMPDMGGLELVERINEIPAERRPAKMIITGNIDDLPAETCADLGISGLLQKRASLSELVSKVQLALSKI